MTNAAWRARIFATRDEGEHDSAAAAGTKEHVLAEDEHDLLGPGLPVRCLQGGVAAPVRPRRMAPISSVVVKSASPMKRRLAKAR